MAVRPMQGFRETLSRTVARQREELLGFGMHPGGQTVKLGGTGAAGREGVRPSCLLGTFLAALLRGVFLPFSQ